MVGENAPKKRNFAHRKELDDLSRNDIEMKGDVAAQAAALYFWKFYKTDF